MHRILFTLAAAFVAMSSCTGAWAIGFTRTITQSTLGQPLSFVATISLEPDESLSRECVSALVTAGDSRIPPPNVRVSVGALRDATQRDIRVTTSTPIDEPVVDIELSIGCNSTMVRRFVAFIDPPSMHLADASPAEGSDADSPLVSTQTAALADMARRSDALHRAASGDDASRGDVSRGRPAGLRAGHGQGLAGGSRAVGSGRRQVASVRHRGAQLASASASGGSRLQLDAPRILLPPSAPAGTASEPVAAVAALDAASAAPESAAATAGLPPAAVVAAASGTVVTEHDRIMMLETGLANLRDESIATRKTIDGLQARLREAEGARYANGLVYALAGISLFLGLLVAGLLWVRPRQRRQARWFEAAAERHARTQRSAEREAAAATPTFRSSPASVPAPAKTRVDILAEFAPEPSGFMQATEAASIGGLEVTTVLGPQFARAMLPPSPTAATDDAAKRSGDLSMEELIDLEQQAEFFVVLGQDEAAMSLLDNYMRSDGGKSPLPYLQLLEIHQRRGDQSAYESVRHSFNIRFRANAPEWSSDLHFGRSLIEYPQTIARLQALWATPLSAMQALDALLFRRHPTEDTFDFPAYRELLFLYSVARELSGQVETDLGSIDLFLPLEDATLVAPMAPMAPSNTLSGGLELAVDLDVSS